MSVFVPLHIDRLPCRMKSTKVVLVSRYPHLATQPYPPQWFSCLPLVASWLNWLSPLMNPIDPPPPPPLPLPHLNFVAGYITCPVTGGHPSLRRWFTFPPNYLVDWTISPVASPLILLHSSLPIVVCRGSRVNVSGVLWVWYPDPCQAFQRDKKLSNS
jgi:hypothetical protein